MTSPQPADQPGLSDTENAVLVALATFLTETALVGATALPLYLLLRMTGLGLDRRAVQAAAALTLRPPIFRTPASGPRKGNTAAALMARQEPRLRALYLLNAAKRITTDLRTVIPPTPGRPAVTPKQQLADALRRERRYWRLHVDAQRKRRDAARAVDGVLVEAPSPWLVWQTRNDTRVEVDCRHLSGSVFTLDDPPILDGRLVLPGTVHPACRCIARPLPASRRPLTLVR